MKAPGPSRYGEPWDQTGEDLYTTPRKDSSALSSSCTQNRDPVNTSPRPKERPRLHPRFGTRLDPRLEPMRREIWNRIGNAFGGADLDPISEQPRASTRAGPAPSSPARPHPWPATEPVRKARAMPAGMPALVVAARACEMKSGCDTGCGRESGAASEDGHSPRVATSDSEQTPCWRLPSCGRPRAS